MSQPDYPLARWEPSPNFWPGFDKRDFIVIHATASGDSATEYVPNFDAASGKSTHYAVALDGGVVQYVEEANSAWGNCCVDGNSAFNGVPGYNWNRSTVSIENEKHSTDNSTPLTPVQYQSLLALVRDIAARWNIPLQHGTLGVRGIIFHHDLMPIEKALCPGNFPYSTFFEDLQGGGPVAIHLDPNGCVVTVEKTFQLETEALPNIPGSPQGTKESPDLCGPWATIALALAVAPGQVPTLTQEQADILTDTMVDRIWAGTGFNHINFQGVLPSDMLKILAYVKALVPGFDFQVIPASMENIYKALDAGVPGLFSCNEQNLKVWNKTSGAWVNAYEWSLNAGHILPFTGYDSFKNIISPDQLSDGKQAGYWPPTYQGDQIALSLSWLCICKLPFLAPLPPWSSWPATFNAQVVTPPVPPPPAITPISLGSAVLIGQTTIDHNGTVVTHNLGRVPSFVLPLLDTGYARADVISVNYGKLTATTFEAYSSEASSGLVRFLIG